MCIWFVSGIFGLCFLLQSQSGFGQADKPRLVLNTGGPTGAVRVLRFSPDSSRLYSAGLDKTVQVWSLRENPPRGLVKATLVRTLRWEIARANRGVIYALDVSPAGGQLAIAGYSTRQVTGDVLVYDPATAEVVRMLPVVRNEDLTGGHIQTVVSVSYSPSGRRLATVSIDGEIRVWSAPDWTSRRFRAARKRHKFPQPVRFLTEDVFAVAGSQDWSISLYDLRHQDGHPRLLGERHSGGVTAIAVDPHSRQWASADEAGTIYLWNGTVNPSASRLRTGRRAASLSFGRTGLLLASTSLDGNRQSVLELWDTNNRRLVDQIEVGTTDHSYACAVSPDGKRAVVYGIDNNEIWLMTLVNTDGTPRQKPFSQDRVLRLSGSGHTIWKVAFASDSSYQLGFDKKRRTGNDGDIAESFDLRELKLLRGEEIPRRWRSPNDGAANWRLVSENNGLRLRLLRNGRQRCRINLDRNIQGPLASFCWLADAKRRPFAVAVGTRGGNGIFIYELVGSGDCPLLRYYRDHNGRVTSLSVSKDGRFLASASADQTIKIWSLEGIRKKGGPFVRENAWGAVFIKRNGRVVLSSLLEAGIAAHRDLNANDVIRSVNYSPSPGHRAVAGDADEILRVLRQNPLWETLVLVVERNGNALERPVLLTPAWEPLVTLFVDRRGEWALWTPQGYYNASVSGDELFGWQINLGRDKKPAFYRADQFRKELERPEFIRRLLTTGSLPAAIRAANVQVPDGLNTRVTQLAQQLPRVTILSPVDKQQLQHGVPLRVVVEVEYPQQRRQDEFVAKAFINGVPGPAPQIHVENGRWRYEWTLTPPDRFNRVEVVVEEVGGWADAGYVAAIVHVDADVGLPKIRVHILSIAAEKYVGGLELDFAVDDASSVLEMFRRNSGPHYQLGHVHFLLDHEVTAAAVKSKIAEIRKQLADVGPNDLLVVFVSGHGIAYGPNYYFVPPDPRLRKFDRALVQKVGISWQLLRGLESIGCRKVYLLDTCRSGNIRLAESKAAIRPLKKARAMVLSATSPNQDALEDPVAEHGYFTRFLLAGFEGNADGFNADGAGKSRDGNVDLQEVVRYVAAEVARETFSRQEPIYTPIELFDLAEMPLFRCRDR